MKANRRALRNLEEGDDAVSPVIAVILMVAITVVLAATVYVWVSGFGGSQNQAPTASFQISNCDTGTNTVTVKLLSASASLDISNLKFYVQSTQGSTPYSTWTPSPSTGSWNVGTTVQVSGGGLNTGNSYTLNVVYTPSSSTMGSPDFNC